MDMTAWIREHSWVLAPAFILTLVLFIWLKGKLAKNVEIKPVDVGIALIPFVLWMASAGIFKKVELPGLLAFETADVIVTAAAEPIDLQVSKIPVTALKADPKSSVREIPRMIASGSQVLSFTLGYSGYHAGAVWMYFNHMIGSPPFKYALILDQQGALFGLFSARKLTAILNNDNNHELLEKYPLKPFRGLPGENDVAKWHRFTQNIVNSNKAALAKVPGFVELGQAVTPRADKKRVLAQMEQLGLDWLPVIRQESGISHFQGIVERSRLTASLILDVTRELENKKQTQEN
ncbi:hypothetical protein [Thalassomonas haliotis]|uniref:CBS domain-containing protein n=1 Tax=Thalassomonas haliotis TaxID=485448 RepID=A0ABY7VEA5_9GAMM|nr:hypothetical protein [Thalassomonas haliotis]WDE11320.1 hypothetical protein H3N35_24380 [Thalassomonas haliotis]